MGLSKVNAPGNKMSDYAQIDSQTEKEIIYTKKKEKKKKKKKR